MFGKNNLMKKIAINSLKTILLFVSLLTVFSGVSQAQVTVTTCYKDGRIVSWLECLTGGTTSPEIDKIKANIPFTAYQKYFEKQLVALGGIAYADDAFNKTVQRMILDIIGLIGGINVIGMIIMFGKSVLQYATARDNEDAIKKAKKRVHAVFLSIILVIVYLLIGQFIASLLGIGSILDIQIFKTNFAVPNDPPCIGGGAC